MPYYTTAASSSKWGHFEEDQRVMVGTGPGRVPEDVLKNWLNAGSVVYVEPELAQEDMQEDDPSYEEPSPEEIEGAEPEADPDEDPSLKQTPSVRKQPDFGNRKKPTVQKNPTKRPPAVPPLQPAPKPAE